MIGNGLGAFIEAILDDRRPKSFDATPKDAEVLRVAIALRAGRPGEGGPDEEFMAGLHRELAEQASDLHLVEEQAGPRQMARASTARGLRPSRPRRALLGVAAAAAVLVGGTVVATNALEQPSPKTTPQVAIGASVRFASLHGAGGRPVGQVYVHRGDPSWIFMTLDAGGTTGTVMCQLQLANGTTVPVGTAQIHDGRAQLAQSVGVDVGQLRGAKLVTPTGSTLASATFS
ncbi:MAG TPA: hypothetical protein VGF64_17820 [Acidimicrobiales bacterium]|jgi:hypothetical protein